MIEEKLENTNEENDKGEKEGNVLAGFILYKDANMDWARFKKFLKEDWDIDAADDVKENALVFKVEDMLVACSLMPNPVPNREAEEAAKYNVLWKDGANVTSQHNAHVMLAVMNKFDAMEQAELFVKVASCLLKLDNAIAIYKDPTVYEKNFYINFAQALKKGDCPVPILVYVGMYLGKEGICAFTSGMRFFGREEIEVVNSKKQPDEVINFMYAIAEYVLSQNVELKDGETIGFTEDEKLPIKVSKGETVSGNSVKIGF